MSARGSVFSPEATVNEFRLKLHSNSLSFNSFFKYVFVDLLRTTTVNEWTQKMERLKE